MQRIVWLFGLALILLCHFGCQSKKDNPEGVLYKEVNCMYAENALQIDGRLDEDEWDDAEILVIEDSSPERSATLRSDNKVLVRTLWNRDNLFMGFHVEDKNLEAEQCVLDHPQLFKDDMVEFLIDARHDKDSCWSVDDVVYHINILKQKKDDRGTADCKSDPGWNGDAAIAVVLMGTINNADDVDAGYDVEIAIAWSELGKMPVVGASVGIDFANGDGGILFDWAGAMPFRSPHLFGDLILKKEG